MTGAGDYLIFYAKKLLRTLDRFVIYLINSKGAVKPDPKEQAMKYTVEINHDEYIDDCTAKEAKKYAKEEACKGNLVFVSWFRASDGQKGYLNSDGNHEITGKAW